MPNYIEAAKIETQLMREFLDLPHNRPDVEDSVWVANVPYGPSKEAIRQLKLFQDHYGFCHVTTGNPPEGTMGYVCGIYVRETAYYDAPNPLADYLSHE